MGRPIFERQNAPNSQSAREQFAARRDLPLYAFPIAESCSLLFQKTSREVEMPVPVVSSGDGLGVAKDLQDRVNLQDLLLHAALGPAGETDTFLFLLGLAEKRKR